MDASRTPVTIAWMSTLAKMMSRPRSPHRIVAAALAATVLLAGGVAATASAAASRPSTAPTRIDQLTALAQQHYLGEVKGQRTMWTLHKLGHDRTLLRLLASPNLGPARAYIKRQYWAVWYHWHVSRMRITRGSHVISEQGVPFCVAASQMTLRGAHGRTLGTLAVSMQDEIGFVRLMHRLYPVEVVVRGQDGQLRTSMYSAGHVKLPSKGTVRLGGRRYLVRSFREPAWGGENVTAWILMQG
jgi:hypothetical protein